MSNGEAGSLSWYQTWWGVVIIGLVVLVVVAVLGLGSVVGYYVWKIKRGEGDDILNKLNETKKPVSAILDSTRKDLETSDDPILGNPKAELVIVEFIDFKCPNSKAADQIIKKVAQKYWNKVKVIVRDFPTESIYPGSSELALLSSCAQNQGKYWALHDIFFANQDTLPLKLSELDTKNLLGQAGVDFAQVQKCLNGSQVKTEINRDYATGFKYGVSGTPTFFINGQKVEGVITFEAWEKFLGRL